MLVRFSTQHSKIVYFIYEGFLKNPEVGLGQLVFHAARQGAAIVEAYPEIREILKEEEQRMPQALR
ncbi:MAG: hypothetical protein LBH38_03435 [Holosporales bacterium]|nr:hypothetical protein [Holosporales bacterium]